MINYKRIIKLFISILILWVLGHLVYVIIDGLIDRKSNADIAVVLGNKVNEDGTLTLEVNPGSYLKIEKSAISMEWTAAINKPAPAEKK